MKYHMQFLAFFCSLTVIQIPTSQIATSLDLNENIEKSKFEKIVDKINDIRKMTPEHADTITYLLYRPLAGIISLFAHELGHALTGKYFGAKPETIYLGIPEYQHIVFGINIEQSPFCEIKIANIPTKIYPKSILQGGKVTFSKTTETAMGRVAIPAAGPLAGAALACTSMIALEFINEALEKKSPKEIITNALKAPITFIKTAANEKYKKIQIIEAIQKDSEKTKAEKAEEIKRIRTQLLLIRQMQNVNYTNMVVNLANLIPIESLGLDGYHVVKELNFSWKSILALQVTLTASFLMLEFLPNILALAKHNKKNPSKFVDRIKEKKDTLMAKWLPFVGTVQTEKNAC